MGHAEVLVGDGDRAAVVGLGLRRATQRPQGVAAVAQVLDHTVDVAGGLGEAERLVVPAQRLLRPVALGRHRAQTLGQARRHAPREVGREPLDRRAGVPGPAPAASSKRCRSR
ncbi:MAG: hypothetical protein U0168_04160 [Nannocystaceae bacterium]